MKAFISIDIIIFMIVVLGKMTILIYMGDEGLVKIQITNNLW